MAPDAPPPARIAQALHKIGLALKHETWVLASEDGVSPTQGQILAMVAGEGPLRPSAIAERLGVTAPTVSDAVRALVDKGLAARERDPADARATLLAVTAAGRARAARATGWTELLAGSVATLSEAEQAVVVKSLQKIIHDLVATGRIPVARMCVTCVHFRPRAHGRGRGPHHCAFVDAPLGDADLRFDCPDHEAAEPDAAAEAYRRFAAP